MHFQSTRGVSKLIFVISLIVALVAGATLSYVWTMGYYASQEYKLPKNPHITIEDVAFPAQNTTFFNITILNPSYSRSSVEVSQIVVLTNDGIQEVEVQDLPYPLKIGSSRTFKGSWNWVNYIGQKMKIIVYVTEGSGPNIQTEIPSYVKLTVEAYFNSSISLQHFNVTVRNADTSATYVDITKLTINEEVILSKNITVNDELVSFPYFLNSSQSVMFTCAWNWTDYQGQSVTVAVETLQGYIATWQNEV